MEMGTETIGKQEFNDVWERVTGSDAAPITVPEPSGVSSGAIEQPPVKTSVAAAPTPDAAKASAVLPAARTGCVEPVTNAAVSDEELDCLREIMEAVATTQRECCALASKCRGRIRRVCRAIEESCRCSNRELNTQYFMQTGESRCPGSSAAPVSNVRDTLRDVCNNEAAVREACVQAAERTDNAALENALLRCANCAAKREQAAENLLGSLLGNGSL